jgi:hypothetical protein
MAAESKEMDKLTQYRAIIVSVIQAEVLHLPVTSDIEPMMVCDDVHDHYQVLLLGWNHTQRVHAVLVHLRLYGGKVRIERDDTSEGMVSILTKAGVSRDDIILAFHQTDALKDGLYAGDQYLYTR